MKKIAKLSEIKVGEIKPFDFDGEEIIIINCGKEISKISVQNLLWFYLFF